MSDTPRAWVSLPNGQSLPVLKWYQDGEETDNPAEATHCVAGPDDEGQYATIRLTSRETHRVH